VHPATAYALVKKLRREVQSSRSTGCFRQRGTAGMSRLPAPTNDRLPILVALELRSRPDVTGRLRCIAGAQRAGSDDRNVAHCGGPIREREWQLMAGS
jgi:hypothetical protein